MQSVAPGPGDFLECLDAIIDDDHGAGELTCNGDDVLGGHARADDGARSALDRRTHVVVAIDAHAGHGEEDVIGHDGARIPGQSRDDATQRGLVTDILAARDLGNVGNRNIHCYDSNSSIAAAATSRSSKWCLTSPII